MLIFNFQPFPVIETERLILREISMRDLNDYFLLRNNISAMKYIGKQPAQDVSEVRSLIELIQSGISKNESIAWGITLKGDDVFIGSIGYHRIDAQHHRAEIGYMLMPDFWNKGLVTEAIKAVVKYGFSQMKLHSIEAFITPENTASSRVLEKNKFMKEAHFKENFLFNNEFLDTAVYSLISNKA